MNYLNLPKVHNPTAFCLSKIDFSGRNVLTYRSRFAFAKFRDIDHFGKPCKDIDSLINSRQNSGSLQQRIKLFILGQAFRPAFGSNGLQCLKDCRVVPASCDNLFSSLDHQALDGILTSMDSRKIRNQPEQPYHSERYCVNLVDLLCQVCP